MQHLFFSFFSVLALRSVTATISLDNPKYIGFDCGRIFFPNHAIQNGVVEIAKKFSTDQLRNIQWPLLRNAKISETAQVLPESDHFYIVFDDAGKLQDVKAKIANGDLVRCSQVQAVRSKLRPPPGNGYECGRIFFDDARLKQEATEAKSRYSQKLEWPKPYVGNLYPKNSHLAWSLSSDGNATTLNGDSPYQLLFTEKGKISNVIAKISIDEYIKCERKFNPSEHRPVRGNWPYRVKFWKPYRSSTFRKFYEGKRVTINFVMKAFDK